MHHPPGLRSGSAKHFSQEKTYLTNRHLHCQANLLGHNDRRSFTHPSKAMAPTIETVNNSTIDNTIVNA